MKWTSTVTIKPVLDGSPEWNEEVQNYAQRIAKDVDLVVLDLTIKLLGLPCTPEQLRDGLAEAVARVQLGTKYTITEVEED